MSQHSLLTTLLPIRDERERTIAYEVRSCPLPGAGIHNIDDEARAVLTLLQRRELLRLVRGRPLHVPIVPALVRGGAVTGFASADVVFFLAAGAIDDADTARAIDRYVAAGFRFGFVAGDEPVPAAPTLKAALLAFDVGTLRGIALNSTVQRLLETGARLIARQVDDRATRERLRASGVQYFSGRPLPRGRATAADARPRVISALRLLSEYADGRPTDARLDAFVANDPMIAESVFRATASAALGVARPRTLAHAFTLLGREAMLERLTTATAFLIADSAGDPELATVAIRRGRMLERLGAAVEKSGHPRALSVAGLLSVADVATGLTPIQLAQEVAAPPLLRDALVERQSPLGVLVDLVEAHENGWWDDLMLRCRRVAISPNVVADSWMSAWQSARSEVSVRVLAE